MACVSKCIFAVGLKLLASPAFDMYIYMNKIVIWLLGFFLAFPLWAQQGKQGPRFFDNWSISEMGGVYHPMAYSPDVNLVSTVFGLELKKQISPIFGVAAEYNYFAKNSHFLAYANARPQFHLSGTLNLNNLFAGYYGQTRGFEIDLKWGLGRSSYTKMVNDTQETEGFLVSKLGADLNISLGSSSLWSLTFRPAVVFDLRGKSAGNLTYSTDQADIQLMVGLTYHFRSRDPQRNFSFKEPSMGKVVVVPSQTSTEPTPSTKVVAPAKKDKVSQKAAETAKKVAEVPQKVVETPQKVTEVKIAEVSKRVTEVPQKVKETKVVEVPKKVVEVPQKIAEAPKKASEIKLVEAPKKVVETPPKATEVASKTTISLQKTAEETPKIVELTKPAKETKKPTKEAKKSTKKSDSSAEAALKVVESARQSVESAKKAVESAKKSVGTSHGQTPFVLLPIESVKQVVRQPPTEITRPEAEPEVSVAKPVEEQLATPPTSFETTAATSLIAATDTLDPHQTSWEMRVAFQQGRSHVDEAQFFNVEQMGYILLHRPNARLFVKGYATPEEQRGRHESLSLLRARTIKILLVAQYGISGDRIIISNAVRRFDASEWPSVAICSVVDER